MQCKARLALTMGKTLAELDYALSPNEFRFWQKYFSQNPEPEKQICNQIAYLHWSGMSDDTRKRYSVSDFVLNYEPKKQKPMREKVRDMQIAAKVAVERKKKKSK